MTFSLPPYQAPSFSEPPLRDAPLARFARAPANAVAPEGFHATSNHPEYLRLEGGWVLLPQSRMDAVVVRSPDDTLQVLEIRRLAQGDLVAVGRSDDGRDGIYLHTEGFAPALEDPDKFAFRMRGTRETPFSRSYDDLYALLRFEREHGKIVWVAGPAVTFDKDSRESFAALIEAGYCHALLAGNALATHDLEAGLFGTGLGQHVYSQQLIPGGHYHHLDILNHVRRAGSIKAALTALGIRDGIMHAIETRGVPYVLAGSIRDDGPLPEVIHDAYEAQNQMRTQVRDSTTVIALATQLHSIAVGNMLPNYTVRDGVVRPVYLILVDISEFSVDKLSNRGSAQVTAIVTNVQDFMMNLRQSLARRPRTESTAAS